MEGWSLRRHDSQQPGSEPAGRRESRERDTRERLHVPLMKACARERECNRGIVERSAC